MTGDDDTVDAGAHTVPSSGASAHLTARPGDGPKQIGRYRILRVIGSGGMGTVYAAHDPELGRDVALKSLREMARSDAQMADRLRREAQALARVVHPNVVAVYDAGIDGDTPFLVMQLIDGVTLDEHLRAKPDIALDEILGLFAQAGRGLCAIHDAKLVHRDVKPANLLVDREGVVHVSDLGLARIGALAPSGPPSSDGSDSGLARGSDVTSGTITRGVAGTPAYMAPEQFTDGEVTAAADQFSYCVSLWEALFGARPFVGGTTDELLDGIKAGRMREPVRDRRVPAAVTRVIRRGLSPDPADRFPSMAALLDDLVPRTRRRWVMVGAIVAAGVGVGALSIAGGGGKGTQREAKGAPIDAAGRAVAQFAGERAKRVTYADACEEFPSFSPDGKTVYFDGQVGMSYHLFAADVATWTVKELTQTEGWDFAASASPDGKHLAWVRRSEAAQSTWVAEVADMRTARKIAVGPARPSWSPDGAYVWTGDRDALERRHVVTGEVVRRIETPEDDVPLLGLELPDGRFVMLGSSAASAGLADSVYLFAASGGPAKVLLRRDGLEEVLVATPEGDAVFVAPVETSGTTTLLRIPLDGGEPTKVAEGGVPARKQLTISHGRAVWSDCAQQTSLATATLTGGKSFFEDLARNPWSDASPEGIVGTTRFVFMSDRTDGVRLWEQDLAKPGPVRRLPFGDIEMVRFAVSLDGTMIAASEGSTGLYVAPVDGSKPPLQLAPDPGDLQPAFSRDGKEVYYERPFGKSWRIAAIPVTGGPWRWIAPDSSAHPAQSPTEDVLAYIVPTEDSAEIRIMDLRTKKERIVPGTTEIPWTGVEWSPDGTRLLLIRNDAYVVEIEATTGKELRRVETGSAMLLGATYVGDEIVVGRTKWAGDLWVTDIGPR